MKSNSIRAKLDHQTNTSLAAPPCPIGVHLPPPADRPSHAHVAVLVVGHVYGGGVVAIDEVVVLAMEAATSVDLGDLRVVGPGQHADPTVVGVAPVHVLHVNTLGWGEMPSSITFFGRLSNLAWDTYGTNTSFSS